MLVVPTLFGFFLANSFAASASTTLKLVALGMLYPSFEVALTPSIFLGMIDPLQDTKRPYTTTVAYQQQAYSGGGGVMG